MAMEFKIRPVNGKSREDQQDAARLLFSSDAMAAMRIKPGDPVTLWKSAHPEEKRVGIAWLLPSAQSMGKGVLQMHSAFRDACGFKLEDKVSVALAESIRTAVAVNLTVADGQETIPEAGVERWQMRICAKIEPAKFVFPGMSIDLVFPTKRSFVVISVEDDAGTRSLMEFGQETKVNIKAANEPQAIRGSRSPLGAFSMVGVDQALERLRGALRNYNKEALPSYHHRRGVIVHGASGVGKSFLLDKISSDSKWPTFRVDEETKARELSNIFGHAITAQPSVIIIDQLDQLTSADQGKNFARRLASELRSLRTQFSSARVVVIGAVQTLSAIPQVLQGGLFDHVQIPVPDAASRKQILTYHLEADGMQVASTQLIDDLAEKTHAYTGRDLENLLQEAYKSLDDRILKQEHRDVVPGEDVLIYEDLSKAKIVARPSAMHDINLAPPKVLWDDIGGQELVKRALRRSVEIPIKYPELMQTMGLSSKKGLLLYGPPGCSKTLSAQAMATEAGFNFFAVKGAELLNMYVGESERAVREIFSRARAASPSIIFFDEIESIGAKRAGKNSGVNVLTTLLNEMDGIETLEGVTVLAATNQPESLDLALLRPGRFDDLLYVAPPDQAGREAILRIRRRMANFADDVDIAALAEMLDGHTGAEIVSVCRKAGEHVLDRCVETGQFDGEASLKMEDFIAVMAKVKKQVTSEMVLRYELWAAGLEVGGG